MTLMGLMAFGYLQAQNSISGKIENQEGEALPGATITIDNGDKGTTSDGEGNYSLSGVSDGTQTIEVSFLGYKTSEKTLNVSKDVTVNFELEEDIFQAEDVIVYATRANEKTATTYSEVSNEEINERNLGQDMPYVLRFTPSMVTTSDAGAGVGYTGMRIRGSDNTRVNVTVNGIPINDSESHGTFWVNMPDFASSVKNVQVQRGVGTSTNGAAAFGATINMQTSLPTEEAYGQIDNSIGSFNTRKHTVIYNTGLINDRWAFEGRLSQIASDGYIDRASSDLRSYYLSGGYYGDKTTVKALTFAGKEKTYQSWYGTPQAKLENDATGIQDVIDWGGEYGTQEQLDNLLNSDRKFNYYLYDNEVDNYQQDHYQLHINHQFNSRLNATGALHYTYGRGYYEQYRNGDDLADYNIDDVIIDQDTVTSTDLIRRRWLDNHFYGGTFSINYKQRRWATSVGGAYNFYDGDHFGEIIWARFAGDSEIRDRYYDNYGRKTDFNIYSKSNYQLAQNLNLFVDLQYRYIDYHTKGIDSDLRAIDAGGEYHFFNPKFGVTYSLSKDANVYASYAVGNREPVRTDFIDALNGETPEHETLKNLEAGYRLSKSNFSLSANYYLMSYENQLVLTGELNDVGSALRTNVDESYRTGVELVGGIKINRMLEWEANVTLSRNKIKDFTEVVYDYGAAFDEFNVVTNDFKNRDIAFSPNVISGSILTFKPISGAAIELLSKYVGKQYLDNTQDNERVIESYFINDARLNYSFGLDGIDNISLTILINNIFDVKYSSNGYTWGYQAGTYQYQQNNYYPQAGRNFLAGLSVRF